jgi:type VI secretion system protein ImpA
MLDLEGLLAPLGATAPSGPDLRYSPQYGDLDRAVEGKPERQAGGTIVAAEPPDWKGIREKCVGILKASKDLRVALILVRALVEGDGFAGLAEGLELLLGLVTMHWDTVHPQLDAEDGGDPTARVSAMAELTHRNMLQALRACHLATFGPFPPVSLRSMEAAAAAGRSGGAKPAPPAPATAGQSAGAAPPPPGPTLAGIDVVFQQVSVDVLAQTATTLALCVKFARGLAEAWAERLPNAGPDFTELRKVLAQADQTVRGRLESRRTPDATAPPPGTDLVLGLAPAVSRSEIQSRDDVLRSLDAICAYYARSEPSSPVPLLLQRGKRLVTMSFGDILKELLPESIPNMQKITGKTD